jgi:hypothetical protein
MTFIVKFPGDTEDFKATGSDKCEILGNGKLKLRTADGGLSTYDADEWREVTSPKKRHRML